MTRLRFNRWGLAEDPTPGFGRRGYYVTWTIGERQYLGEVVATYRRETPPAIMLKVRHFDGSEAPDVAASVVQVIDSKGDS